jgi:hypothetical protein
LRNALLRLPVVPQLFSELTLLGITQLSSRHVYLPRMLEFLRLSQTCEHAFRTLDVQFVAD